jgi:hypothetical protein
MRAVLQTEEQVLLSLSSRELTAITHALNEVCNSISISDNDFDERLGVTRPFAEKLLAQMEALPHESNRRYQALDYWHDNNVFMIRAVSVFGDPVELGDQEQTQLVSQLQASPQ